MSLIVTDDRCFHFPSVDAADDEGLLVVGGIPTPNRVLEGCRKGIFAWYDHDSLPLWWSPNPRFVLRPENLHVSGSMRRFLSKASFTFATNKNFDAVIDLCGSVKREGQNGTWITYEMKQAYMALHRSGLAHSAEAWNEGKLVGGLYGIKIGAVFFAESMFHLETNASKFVLIHYVRELMKQGVRLIDCQVHTHHLESLGASFMFRTDYIKILEELCSE